MDASVKTQTAIAPLDSGLCSELWHQTLEEVRLQMTKATFDTWFTCAEFYRFEEPDIFVISVRNSQSQDWMNSRYNETIVRILTSIAGRPLRVFATVNPDKVSSANPTPGKNGSSPPLVKSPQKSASDAPEPGPEQDQVKVVISASKGLDPKRGGYIQTNHYSIRFWRPFLGGKAFDLLQVLSAYHYEVTTYGLEWPTVEHLARKLGFGTRHTILGRKYKDRPEQVGLLHELAAHHLLTYRTEFDPEKKHDRYVVENLITVDMLPMLTPDQVTGLSRADQLEHEEWLERFKYVIDIETWRKLKT